MKHLIRPLGFMLFLGLALSLLRPTSVLAQDAPPAPFAQIVQVDSSKLPNVTVAFYGDIGVDDLSTVPVELAENEQPQTKTADRTEPHAGLQLAVVIDSHALTLTGASGQPHLADLNSALLELVQKQIIIRNEDRLAAFTMLSTNELQTIQDWTSEPNLIFNSIVQHPFVENAITDQLIQALAGTMERFAAGAGEAPQAKAILLFTSGAAPIVVEQIVKQATENKIHIHVVEMVSADDPPLYEDVLKQIAQKTNGQFVLWKSAESLAPIWHRLKVLHQQRFLTYASTAPSPEWLSVALTLPDGSTVEASEPVHFAASAVAQTPTVATVAGQTPITQPTALAAAPVATVAAANPTVDNSAPAVPAPESNPASAVTNDSVLIPGTSILLPKIILQGFLFILLVLLGYIGYREWRERRAPTATRSKQTTTSKRGQNDPFQLSEPSERLEPLRKSKPNVPPLMRKAPVADEDEVQVHEAERTPPVASRLNRQENDDGVTVVPTPFGDDDATYRLSDDVEQPVIGTLLRVTNNPTLPQELSIFGLAAGQRGERRTHVGRHSKNNTVVINDKSVSREHAVIVHKEGRLYLRDNASTAGTFLNWRRLKPGEELLLRHNDLLSFGGIVYEFRAKGDDEATVNR
jgi:hypothetical protein